MVVLSQQVCALATILHKKVCGRILRLGLIAPKESPKFGDFLSINPAQATKISTFCHSISDQHDQPDQKNSRTCHDGFIKNTRSGCFTILITNGSRLRFATAPFNPPKLLPETGFRKIIVGNRIKSARGNKVFKVIDNRVYSHKPRKRRRTWSPTVNTIPYTYAVREETVTQKAIAFSTNQ